VLAGSAASVGNRAVAIRLSGLYIFLRREKSEDGTIRWRVNHKRVYRLYREEVMTMQ
jgi:hypothetical protein